MTPSDDTKPTYDIGTVVQIHLLAEDIHHSKGYVQSIPLSHDQPYIIQLADTGTIIEVDEKDISIPPIPYDNNTIADAPSWIKPGLKCTLYIRQKMPIPPVGFPGANLRSIITIVVVPEYSGPSPAAHR